MNDISIGNDVTMRSSTQAVLGRIDQYELLKELGGGGFGTVYLARDTVSGVEVAVKGLPPLVRSNREELENIRTNFALVSRLHHPNIAAALVLHPARSVSYGGKGVAENLRVFEGDSLMVMEYAPGVTLSQWRKQFPDGKVPIDQAIAITRQIASALDYAHEQKIIHRDIKPSNVMIETRADGSLVARVLDFGLAAEIRSSMGRISQEIHDTSGTRPYMAPEQWLGKKQGAATDQYALAVLAYELLTGAVPFASVFETGDPVVMMNVVGREKPEIAKCLPRKVCKTFSRAFVKDPTQRFPSCELFVVALYENRRVSSSEFLRICGASFVLMVLGFGGYAWFKPVTEVARPDAIVRQNEIARTNAIVRSDVIARSDVIVRTNEIAQPPEPQTQIEPNCEAGADPVVVVETDVETNQAEKIEVEQIEDEESKGKVLADQIAALDGVKTNTLAVKNAFSEERFEDVARLLSLADQDDAEVNFVHGWMILRGKEFKKDEKLALAHFRKAAEKGHAEAWRKIGVMYQCGAAGLNKDLCKAAECFRHAVDGGDGVACQILARMYESGQGVPADLQEAKKLCEMAILRNRPGAKADLDRIEKKLAASEEPTRVSVAPNIDRAEIVSPPQSSDTHFLRDAIRPYIDNGSLPGAIGVYIKNGVMEEACMGWADIQRKRPLRMDSTFMICSQSKSFCGVCLAILLEEGKIGLDDEVSRYLPNFGNMTVIKDGKTCLSHKQITLRQLMTDCAGFPFDLEEKKNSGWVSMSIESVADAASKCILQYEPGTKRQYSNIGCEVSARIIEIVTGRAYDDFLKARVLLPLGMTDTSFNPSDEQLSRRMLMYKVDGKNAPLATENQWMPLPHNGPRVHVSAASGLWSTANDLLKFCKMLMMGGVGENGVRILKTETVRQYLETTLVPQNCPSKLGYSLGFALNEKDKTFGHGGAWGTNFRISSTDRELVLWVVQILGSPRPWNAARDAAFENFRKDILTGTGGRGESKLERETIEEYVVKAGDTLGSLAYGHGMNIRQLKELNGIGNETLRVGQRLKLKKRDASETVGGRNENWKELLGKGYKSGGKSEDATRESMRNISLIKARFDWAWDQTGIPPWKDSLRVMQLQFKLGATGKVLSYELTQSSGDPSVDATVLNAAKLMGAVDGLSSKFIQENGGSILLRVRVMPK